MRLLAETTEQDSRLTNPEDLRPLEEARAARVDRLLGFTAQRLRAPIAWVSVVDGDRHGVVSAFGLPTGAAPRWDAPCVHTLLASAPLGVPDASVDARFHHLPLVRGAPSIRWYAGAAIRSRDGRALGTLAVADPVARDEILSADLDLLADVARSLADVLEPTIAAPSPTRGGYEARTRACRLEILDRMLRMAPLEEVLEHAARLGEAPDPARSVSVLVARGDELVVARAGRDGLLPLGSTVGADPDEGPAGLAASIARIVAITDVSQEDRWPSWRNAALAEDVHAATYRPVLDADGRVLGVVAKHLRQPVAAFDAGALDEVVRFIAAAITRHRVDGELDRFFDLSDDLVCICRPDGWFDRVNPAWERLLGFSRDELTSRPLPDFVHPDDAERTLESFDELLATGAPTNFENRFRRRDGTWIWLQWSAQFDAVHERIHAIARDVTREKQLQDQLATRLRRLTAMRAVDAAITSAVDVHHVLAVLVGRARECLDVDAVGILVYDRAAQVLSPIAGDGFRTRYVDAPGTAVGFGEGVAGRAALERTTVAIDDVRATQGARRARFAAAEGVVTYVATPLIAKSVVHGVLEIFHRRPLVRDDDWMSFLQALAVQAAIALDNHGVLSRLERSLLELRLAYDRTLEGWARSLDLRAGAEDDHSRRLATLTVRLARSLGLSEMQLEQVYRGALLHDVGEMLVPDGLLEKPGALTPEEFELVKQHPVHGKKLLERVSFLSSAAAIPWCHHERWDGTGYPQGLAGEAIPIEARVFAVVDVYDALTHDRPHRPAWSGEQAIAHLREQAGHALDPRVVEAFLALDLAPREG